MVSLCNKGCTRSCARIEQVTSIPAMAAYHPRKYKRMPSEAPSKGRHVEFHLPGMYHNMFMTAVTNNFRDRNPAGDFIITGYIVLV